MTFFATFNAMNLSNNKYVGDFIKVAEFRAEAYLGYLNTAKCC